jgi:hypothetical protein
MKSICGVALTVFAASVSVGAQTPTVTVDYKNPGLTPSHWVLAMHLDGSAQFDSDGAAPTPGGPRTIEAGDIHRPVHLSQPFVDQVFAVARDRKLFSFPCESHMKVAFQGTKHLSYSGPEGEGSCEFNYSKDKQIESLANSLIAVELTLLSGARLEKQMQHDKLGLDAELESLSAAVHEGNALEVGTIREILTRIATDPDVLDRARRKARALLTQAH